MIDQPAPDARPPSFPRVFTVLAGAVTGVQPGEFVLVELSNFAVKVPSLVGLWQGIVESIDNRSPAFVGAHSVSVAVVDSRLREHLNTPPDAILIVNYDGNIAWPMHCASLFRRIEARERELAAARDDVELLSRILSWRSRP